MACNKLWVLRSIGTLKTTPIRNMVCSRTASTTSTTCDFNQTQVNTQVTLCSHVDRTPRQDEIKRPLSIILPWLNAPRKAIEKYRDVYLEKGYDVLLVNSDLRYFLWPNSGKAAARELLDFLATEEKLQETDQVLIHSFSIGAYFYTLIMMEMAENAEKYKPVRQKIYGQIFDSITVGGLSKMRRGMVHLIKNPLLKNSVNGVASIYFLLTKKHTVEFYDEAVDHFKFKPLKTPILFFYCMNDPMADPDVIEEMIYKWKDPEGGYAMDVFSKSWPESIHAGHLREHPLEYRRALDSFISHAGIHSVSEISCKL